MVPYTLNNTHGLFNYIDRCRAALRVCSAVRGAARAAHALHYVTSVAQITWAPRYARFPYSRGRGKAVVTLHDSAAAYAMRTTRDPVDTGLPGDECAARTFKRAMEGTGN